MSAARKLAKELDNALMAEMLRYVPMPRQTALRLRGNELEVVEIDDKGNIIEPPRRCPKCGPIVLCIEHMVLA